MMFKRSILTLIFPKKWSVKADLPDTQRAENIRNMFARIAHKYDLMNQLMTFGQDQVWRRYVIKKTELPDYGSILDIGTGTGSIAIEACLKKKSALVVGADFSVDMMQVGQSRINAEKIVWCASDALELPFQHQIFDAVTSGYLVRNVTDIHRAFKEQFRVLRPNGKVVCLETCPLQKNWFRPFIFFYLNFVIPFIGNLISGQSQAYTYLPNSTQKFKTPDQLAQIMRNAGFADVWYTRFMFGTIGVHVGTRPGK